MQASDFTFELPEHLVAQYPPSQRGASRLLCLDRNSGAYTDRFFESLVDLLETNDLLVFNDTRVIPARLFARKISGGKVEILLERLLDEHSMLCQLRASKMPKAGTTLVLEDETELEIVDRDGDFFRLRLLSPTGMLAKLEQLGHMPLPPYIRREDNARDRERYQTIYAREPGAVAAPTAGLHFTEELLGAIEKKGVTCAFITLHVGAGTFQPVRSEIIENHRMHREWFSLDESVCASVREAKKNGGRVIAVGTTSVRGLESASRDGGLQAMEDDTDIFIYPGYEFQVVDAMVTNFHLPESTLLMLVCAFAGRENILRAYRHAVDESYRFFSYGDAMFIF